MIICLTETQVNMNESIPCLYGTLHCHQLSGDFNLGRGYFHYLHSIRCLVNLYLPRLWLQKQLTCIGAYVIGHTTAHPTLYYIMVDWTPRYGSPTNNFPPGYRANRANRAFVHYFLCSLPSMRDDNIAMAFQRVGLDLIYAFWHRVKHEQLGLTFLLLKTNQFVCGHKGFASLSAVVRCRAVRKNEPSAKLVVFSWHVEGDGW